MIFFFLNTYYREEGNVVEESSRRQQCQSFLLNIKGSILRQKSYVRLVGKVISSGVFCLFFCFISLEFKTVHLQDNSPHLSKASLIYKRIKSQEGKIALLIEQYKDKYSSLAKT